MRLTPRDVKLPLIHPSALTNALTVSLLLKSDVLIVLYLSAVEAVIASPSAAKVSLNALVKVSRSEAICLGSQE